MKTIQQLQAKADDLNRLNEVIEEVQTIPYIFDVDEQDQQKIEEIAQWLYILHSKISTEMNRDFEVWRKVNKI